LIPVSLAFAYDTKFVPKGCRIPQERYFRGKGSGVICRAESHEAVAAYRIHVPPFNHRPEYVFEILRFENKLWWPIKLPNDAVPSDGSNARGYDDIPAAGSAIRCIDELSADGVEASRRFSQGERGKDGWFRGPFCRTSGLETIESVPIRSTEWTHQDLAFAFAQRRTMENLLLCGDEAYVLGGHPIYLQSYRTGEEPAFGVVSASPDRSWDPAAEHLPDYFGNSWLFRHGVEIGNCFHPDQADVVSDYASLVDEPIPRIETLINPIEQPIALIEMRLDALFRAACTLFLTAHRRYSVRGQLISELQPILSDLENLSNRAVDEETTTDRCSVLRRLVDALESLKVYEEGINMFRIAVLLVFADSEFEELARAHKSLSPEDEESLKSLF
jgi:hypothetical protein